MKNINFNQDGKKVIEQLKEIYTLIKEELQKVIIGQTEVIEQVLISLFAGGHVLLEGVPGLGKTYLIKSLSEILDLKFSRIQFTPDLMPSDIIGSDIIEESEGKRHFRFIPGPIFANIVLADEINRTPPKTQSALLQAMQENQITVGGKSYNLDPPFFVMATQNPIEAAGTYPLPEAQLDRFMFKILIFYPNKNEETKIVKETTSDNLPKLNKVISKDDILKSQSIIRNIPVAEHILEFAVDIVKDTRKETTKFNFVKEFVSWGASPRASQYLILGAKVRAALNGRFTPTKEDVKRLIYPTLRHRILLNFSAEAERVKVEDIIEKILESYKNV